MFAIGGTADIHAVDQIEDLSAGMNAIANKISIKSAFASNLILKIAQQLDITLCRPWVPAMWKAVYADGPPTATALHPLCRSQARGSGALSAPRERVARRCFDPGINQATANPKILGPRN